MRHDSERPAILYQQEAQDADPAITGAIHPHIATAKAGQDDDSGDSSGEQLKLSNGVMARGRSTRRERDSSEAGHTR
jgi:hypothetical protein